MRIVDTHCHLTCEEYDADRQEVLRRAREAGVAPLLTVGTGPADWEKCAQLAATEPDVYFAAAIHPHDAGKTRTDPLPGDKTGAESFPPPGNVRIHVLRLADSKRFVAVGETGLDFYYMHSPREVQIAVFRSHLELACELGVPVIIHCRDAFPDVFRVLADFAPLRGVMHCFSGGEQEAAKAIALGLHVSFAGVLTFKNARKPIEVLKTVPDARLLLETDCPYLAPAPYRGRRNEPAFLVETVRKAAELKGMTADALAELVTQNACELFGLPSTAIGRGGGA